MRKLLAILFVLCAMTAKAQVFVGGIGAVGYANERFHLGLIPEIGYEFNEGLCGSDLGLRPSFRFFLNKNWNFNADFGLFGARYDGYDWQPAFFVTGFSVKLGVAYKF